MNMILIGQFDSPFVRRVAITLHIYGIPFERDRTSVFSPAMTRLHPLRRVPSLILDDDEALWDSASILDHLDERADPDAVLTPRSGLPRRQVQRATAIAAGAAEKAVAILYEGVFHEPECVSGEWIERCRGPIDGGLTHLDEQALAPWFFGDSLTQADVTIGCLVSFLRLRLDAAFPRGRYAAIEAISSRCDALDAFFRTLPAPDEVMPATGTAPHA
jgi:glutathione S-transferase